MCYVLTVLSLLFKMEHFKQFQTHIIIIIKWVFLDSFYGFGKNTSQKTLLFIKINLQPNIEIFLIRHGLGVYNKMNLLNKIINTKIDSQLDPQIWFLR